MDLLYSLPFKGRARVGMGCGKYGHDAFDDCFRFLKNLIVPKTKHPKACYLKEARSLIVCTSCFRMLPPIKFDDQLSFQADKIENIVAERMLAAKLHAKLFAAQELPEKALGVSCFFPEFLRNPVFLQPRVVLSLHSLPHPPPGLPLEGGGA